MRTAVTSAALALVAALAVPEAAQAQFRFGGRGFHGPAAFTQAGVFNRHLQSINFSRNPWNVMMGLGHLNYLWNPGFYGWGGWGVAPIDSGSMADLVKQQQQAVQEAQRQQQERRQQRQQLADEMRYEQARNLRAAQEWRREQLLIRSRSNPDLPQITSGWALNDLLDELIARHRDDSVRGPLVPVDPELLKNVNFASTTGGGGVGLFRGPIPWPEPLSSDLFREQRERIERALPDALREAAAGAAERPAVRELNLAITALRDHLRANRDDIPAMTYLNALEFFRNLEGSGLALAQQAAPKLLDGSLRAEGRSVHEVVDSMARQGIRFAAASPGQEQAYADLYQALLSYATGLAALAAR